MPTHAHSLAGVLALSIALPCSTVVASAPSIDEIVQHTEQVAYYAGADGRADVTMEISDSRSQTRKRRFTILRRDRHDDSAGGNQKYYVYINYPSDLKNTALVVWKQPRTDDDRWLYLPGLDLVKRLAASDKRTSFLGSNFFYEDISGRATALDEHQLVEVTDNYYVVKNTPKRPDAVEFSHYTMWIHKHSWLPVKVEFYDRQNAKHRVYEVLEVDTIDGHPTVVKSRMRDLALDQETVLTFRRVRYDVGLDESLFNERYLRRPPRDALR